MKKKYLKDLAYDLLPYIITMFLVLACGEVFGGTPRLNKATPTTRDGALVWVDDITWHKKIQTGVDSVFTFETESAVLVSTSDTLISDCFRNKDVISLQPVLGGAATTVDLVVVIQTANCGTYYPAIMPDSLFADTYWLTKGTGISNCYANTTLDTLTSTTQSTPINIPLLGCDLFRILVYTTASQVGNTSIRIPAILKEE